MIVRTLVSRRISLLRVRDTVFILYTSVRSLSPNFPPPYCVFKLYKIRCIGSKYPKKDVLQFWKQNHWSRAPCRRAKVVICGANAVVLDLWGWCQWKVLSRNISQFTPIISWIIKKIYTPVFFFKGCLGMFIGPKYPNETFHVILKILRWLL